MKMQGFLLAAVAMIILTGSGMCQVWEGAQPIDPGSGDPFNLPQISMGPNGSAIAIFRDWNGAGNRIYVNHYVPGSGWSTPVAVDSNLGGSTNTPGISIGQNGNAMAVFVESTALGNYHACANYYVSGWTWTRASIIDANAGGTEALSPHAALDASGNALAVFSYGPISADRMYGRRYDAGSSSWPAPQVQIDNSTWGLAYKPQLAMNSSGNAVAVFEQLHGAVQQINATRYVAGGGWITPPAQLSDGSKGYAFDPQIAAGPNDEFIAVFWQRDSDTLPYAYHVYASRFDSSSWGGFERIDDPSAGYSSYPQIAYSADGSAIAVFIQIVGAANRIYANRFQSSSWTGAVVIDAGTGANADVPQVAMDAYGNALAVFKQSDGSYSRVYAAYYTPGSGWGTAAIIDAATGKEAANPHIASDAEGNAIAVFTQRDPSNNGRVYANRFIPPTPTPTMTPTPTATPTPVIDLTPNKNVFSTKDRIEVRANVQPISIKCYPFIRVILPNGRTLYYVRGKGFVRGPAGYLGNKPLTVGKAIYNYLALAANFSALAKGTYYLEGGAVDATQTTSVNNLVYVDGVDRETLTVQ